MSICKHCKVKDICHNHIKCDKWCDGYVDTKSFYDYNVGEKIYYAGLMGKYFTVCTGTIERYELSVRHLSVIANFRDKYSLLGDYEIPRFFYDKHIFSNKYVAKIYVKTHYKNYKL